MTKPLVVLGINHSNDAAATLVVDGHVVAASQEERWSRVKHDRSFPHRAIRFCLEHAGLSLDDVDAVAFFWNPGIHAEVANWRQSAQPRHHLEYLHSVPSNLLPAWDGDSVESVEQIFRMGSGRKLTVHYVTHHLCHAASVLYRAPFDECAILTVDGYGERASTHLAAGRGLRIETLRTIEYPHSVGMLYAALTQYLGFRANSGEGKVMGLASYGRPTYMDAFRRLYELTDHGFRLDLSYFSFFTERRRRYSDRLVELLGPERAPESPLDQRHMDIAASLQLATEELLLHLVGITRELTHMTNLGMAGGVVLNCVANGRIQRESGFDRFFFQPAAGDAGTSQGAALWVTHGIHGLPRVDDAVVDTLGPSFDDDSIERELRRANVRYVRLAAPEATAARLVAGGRIVGWFQGRAEFGPRALGNRTIVADPRGHDTKDVLNARVKFREPFRPFAPSVLEERCGEWFSSGVPSPFMLRVYDTLPEKRGVVPAITHVDGTARVQTVNRKHNPRYYRLIEEFERLTGVPMVLNTSFNIRGEPIVNSVADALKCYLTTDMDALVIGDFGLARDPAILE
ncbi:MAG: carbamoyltransferase [Myxococcales bacterium]